jgi:transketolase
MRLYLPVVAADVETVVSKMAEDPLPNYLRLNEGAMIPGTIPAFAPWRKLKSGRSAVVIGMGPVLQGLYELGAPELFEELEIWSVGTFPIENVPAELAAIIGERHVITIEEHYRACGLGEALSHLFLSTGVVPKALTSLHAAGYPSGRYGSQRWHQAESGLVGAALSSRLERLLRA